MMKTSRLSLLLVATLICGTVPAASAAGYEGVGESTCPEFSIRSAIDASHRTTYIAWMQGYLAALNDQAFKAGATRKQVPVEPLLYEAVVTYCRKAGILNNSLEAAAAELYALLPAK